jgi:hypothetical protein
MINDCGEEMNQRVAMRKRQRRDTSEVLTISRN